jgi:Aldo/keto reductase family
VVIAAAEHRRPHEVAPLEMLRRLWATGDEPHSLVDAGADVAADAVALDLGDDRPGGSSTRRTGPIMLRWHLQRGRSAIPKSTKPVRIAENFDVFDFELTAEQCDSLDALDTGKRGGPEPEAITLEAFGREIPEA